MSSFNGTQELTLDAKSRLTVPAKQRGLLASGVTIAKGRDRCLQVWPSELYDAEAERLLGQVNALTDASSRLRRALYGESQRTEVDSAGRIMLNRKLMDRAGLRKDVTFVGAGRYFELWDREEWRAVEDEVGESAADLIERLGNPS